jgi:RNA polymerase sigma-70 factor (ECF subfamily)
MNSQAGRSFDRFATTRWSMAMQLAAVESPDARRALGELAQRYWYPVYAYVRRCGHAPDIAQEITLSFLQRLLRDAYRNTEQRAPALYRRYLLDRLHAFLAGDWTETVKVEPPAELLQAPADLEARFQSDHVHTRSPEETYQRGFALEVLHRAFRRLRSEAAETGRMDMYEALQGYLARDPGPGEYELIARRVGSRALALVLALKRLRQRFQELAAEELADTVGSADDLAAEQEALLRVLDELHQ